MTRKSKNSIKNNIKGLNEESLIEGRRSLAGYCKHFYLAKPFGEQILKYHQFVLTSIFRLLSDSYLLEFSLEDFLTRSLQILMSHDRSILEMERIRMEWTDSAIREPIQFVERIMSVTIKPLIFNEKKEDEIEKEKANEKEKENENDFAVEVKNAESETTNQTVRDEQLVTEKDEGQQLITMKDLNYSVQEVKTMMISEYDPELNMKENQNKKVNNTAVVDSCWSSEFDISF